MICPKLQETQLAWLRGVQLSQRKGAEPNAGDRRKHRGAFHPEPLSEAPLGWFLEDSLGMDAGPEHRREEKGATPLILGMNAVNSSQTPSGLQHLNLTFRGKHCLHPNNLFSAPSSPAPSSVLATKNRSRKRDHCRDGSCSIPLHRKHNLLSAGREFHPPSKFSEAISTFHWSWL